jgi:HxlR-like helix-turn-helix
MADCGLDTVLALIAGKWKMLILYHLCHAPRRFGELRRLLPVPSEKGRLTITASKKDEDSAFNGRATIRATTHAIAATA